MNFVVFLFQLLLKTATTFFKIPRHILLRTVTGLIYHIGGYRHTTNELVRRAVNRKGGDTNKRSVWVVGLLWKTKTNVSTSSQEVLATLVLSREKLLRNVILDQ